MTRDRGGEREEDGERGEDGERENDDDSERDGEKGVDGERGEDVMVRERERCWPTALAAFFKVDLQGKKKTPRGEKVCCPPGVFSPGSLKKKIVFVSEVLHCEASHQSRLG